jgi:glycine/D-amino acid oxidase-like deaminating enzyme
MPGRRRLVVIGSGIAGLYAALLAADAGASVVLLTKGGLDHSNTWYAQGGISAVLDEPAPGDTAAAHITDTLQAGAGHCNADAVRLMCTQARHDIAGLQRFGVHFDLQPAGSPALGLEAAHSAPRILHAGGDATGAKVAGALIQAVLSRQAAGVLTVITGAHATSLLHDDGTITGVQSILGQMVTASPCGRCGGQGQVIASPCTDCHGEGRKRDQRSYTIEVPAGVDDGATLRLTGRGAVGPRGGGAGDLYVHLRVRPHERFARDGDDLVHEMHVSMTQAALGADITLATLDGDEVVPIAPGTQNDKVLRIRGKGVPRLQGRGRGDLRIHVVVDTPTELNGEQEELLRRLAELRGEAVAEPESGLFSRIKSAFR